VLASKVNAITKAPEIRLMRSDIAIHFFNLFIFAQLKGRNKKDIRSD
jgi:hypothetical protein